MAWTGTVSLDSDKPDVGIATAVWDSGMADEFQYSRRAKMTASDKAAFIAEAKAALTAYQSKTATEATYAGLLTTGLNS